MKVKRLGAGQFGTCNPCQAVDGELVACEYLPRAQVDENVEREVRIQSTLHHPNIVGFESVFCMDQHLVIVMEYAKGGQLLDLVIQSAAGHFLEHEARYFFQQLGVAHRDLKLEYILLDGSAAPILKEILDGQLRDVYDGAAADVWSCSVLLYVMLAGVYPFEDPRDKRNHTLMMQNNRTARYAVPDLELSAECKELLRKILVVDPRSRITIAQIKEHPWYLFNLPNELKDGCKGLKCYPKTTQAPKDIADTIRMAQSMPPQQQQQQQQPLQAGSHSA